MVVRKYPLKRWKQGDYKVNCERCGWDYLRSELVKEDITGALVCTKIDCVDPPAPRLRRRYFPVERPIRKDGGGAKDPT